MASHAPTKTYLVSLCSVWRRQKAQYFLSFTFSGFVRLFLVVE
ncbi:hypothetical protein PPSIR1_23989 [Plesiocystis pacifica SIR-1]|uniref:Uncharacterized protein n=1 Tax=Plesiocystis pacifica SIR-1 TaxID=391625 RepID=A6GCJ2_9BACT|nr:hypothetical protein PPSIR1_23989 [Plesiocystis pacifica SIR-1]